MFAICDGNIRIDDAKIGGMTPETLILSGRIALRALSTSSDRPAASCTGPGSAGARARSSRSRRSSPMTRIAMNRTVRPPTPLPRAAARGTATIASGIAATMPAKMIIDEPLPMPLSVMSSPSHMMTAVPVVSVSTVSRRKPRPGSATTSAPPFERLST